MTNDAAGGSNFADCKLGDDGGDGDGGSAAPRRRRGDRLRRGRARLRHARRHQGGRAQALDAEFTKYTPVPGIAELRRAVCDRYKTDYGVEYTEPQVILTAGGKQALYNTALALFGPGDEVITHAPYWPTIVEQVKLADATPVVVETRPDDGFAIHADAILRAITPRTRGIIINSPCNPTGALISEEDLGAIADVAAKQDIWLVVDLCYEKLIYDPVPHNLPRVLAAKCPDLAVICGSASKAYAMTGWRCGWTIGPAK